MSLHLLDGITLGWIDNEALRHQIVSVSRDLVFQMNAAMNCLSFVLKRRNPREQYRE